MTSYSIKRAHIVSQAKKYLILLSNNDMRWYLILNLQKETMTDEKPLFKAPYNIKDVSALFAIVAFVLILAAIVGNNLFGVFQQNINFG